MADTEHVEEQPVKRFVSHFGFLPIFFSFADLLWNFAGSSKPSVLTASFPYLTLALEAYPAS
jgi:hypothetical protein